MYKYELHCHTSEVSGCAVTPAAKMIDFYKKCGFSGVVIADHLLSPTCTVPKELPWNERIDLFCKGYENAKKRGDEIGINVFFAWESRGDFVTLGLGKEWLKQHENLDKMSAFEYLETVRYAGGYIIHAHPFREREYIKAIQLYPRKVDAIETINTENSDFQNSVADYFADKYKLTRAAGSDSHSDKKSRLGVVELSFKAKSLDDIIEAMKNNSHTVKEYEILREDDNIKLKERIPVIE